jgi:hypothetical protein
MNVARARLADDGCVAVLPRWGLYLCKAAILHTLECAPLTATTALGFWAQAEVRSRRTTGRGRPELLAT